MLGALLGLFFIRQPRIEFLIIESPMFDWQLNPATIHGTFNSNRQMQMCLLAQTGLTVRQHLQR